MNARAPVLVAHTGWLVSRMAVSRERAGVLALTTPRRSRATLDSKVRHNRTAGR